MADIKPSTTEEEYFLREEAEKLRRLAAERKKRTVGEDREALRQEHWMRCPKCGDELQTIRFRGVDIDRCFGCGGCWLDDGELEKLAGEEGGKVMRSVLNIFYSPKGERGG
jgi:uncharacterized protein